jgi:uncharacterized membrane protein
METAAKDKERLVDVGSDLVEAYRNLITIKIVEHTSMGASVGIIGLLGLVTGMFILLFAGLGAAWWLGEYLNNMKAGFFIVGGIYVVILIVLLATSKKVIVPQIRNLIIRKIYDQD